MKEVVTRNNAPPPTVQVIEPIGGAWTKDNTWGISKTYPWPATAGYRLPIIAKTEFPGPHNRRLITLTRQMPVFDSIAGPTDLYNSDIQAEIVYGVGGNTETVMADWVNGSVLLVPAGSMSVNAITYNPSPEAGGYSPGPASRRLKLGVMFGGSGQGTPVGTFTQVVYPDPLSDRFGPVPRQARAVTIFVPVFPAAPALTSFILRSNGAGAVAQYTYPAAAPTALQTETWTGLKTIPVPGNAASWRMTFTAATEVILRWDLNI